MLRGPQTLGELKQRSERLHRFGSTTEVAETLDALARRELVTRERRPGQKEERYIQLLGAAEAQRTGQQGLTPAVPDRLGEIEARLAKLEAAFTELSARIDS
jgi:uncharacterized protein YceH (UPF0502 family)